MMFEVGLNTEAFSKQPHIVYGGDVLRSADLLTGLTDLARFVVKGCSRE